MKIPGLRYVADVTRPGSVASSFRRRRFALFQSLIAPLPRPVRILDVGGSPAFWVRVGFTADEGVHILVVNKRREGAVIGPNMRQELGDARQLSYPDQAFDVVVSNSVIEHVGDFADQARMAQEIRRVGRRYFVQTPNRSFPLEPHFLFPFFQFLPLEVRAWLLSRFQLGWHPRQEKSAARETVRSIRLVTAREMRIFFPGAKLYRESVLGLTKGFVAYDGW